MGSGAMYLPHYFYGIENWFKKDEHLSWWRVEQELYSYTDYYLGRESDRKNIAEAGQIKVHLDHSWESRMGTMIRMVKGRQVKVF